MTPRERIIELLKNYHYACAPATTGGRIGRSRFGSVGLRFEDMWYEGSYAELTRCLNEMHVLEPVLHWHVTRRYIHAEVRPMDVPMRKYQEGPRPILAPYCELAGKLPGHTGRTCRVLVRRWDHRVRSDVVKEALSWLEREMFAGQTDRITLPELIPDAA